MRDGLRANHGLEVLISVALLHPTINLLLGEWTKKRPGGPPAAHPPERSLAVTQGQVGRQPSKERVSLPSDTPMSYVAGEGRLEVQPCVLSGRCLGRVGVSSC